MGPSCVLAVCVLFLHIATGELRRVFILHREPLAPGFRMPESFVMEMGFIDFLLRANCEQLRWDQGWDRDVIIQKVYRNTGLVMNRKQINLSEGEFPGKSGNNVKQDNPRKYKAAQIRIHLTHSYFFRERTRKCDKQRERI